MIRHIALLRRNPMMDAIFNLRGNQRACLYLEALWGIPYNLYVPYASLYMSAMGLRDSEIGLITTLFIASQIVFSVLGGALTDKLGRRLCTLIFDTISWSVPTLIWALIPFFVRNGGRALTWYAVAALLNGAWRVTVNSWGCLLVEDAQERTLVHLFAIMYISGLLAAFFAPIASLLVARFGMTDTVQALYGVTCLMMTAKFVLLYRLSRETSIGARRRESLRGVPFRRVMYGYGGVIRMMLRTPITIYTILLLACFALTNTISGTFLSLYLTGSMGVTEAQLPLFATLRSVVMLVCYFTIVPRLTSARAKKPLLVGFSVLLISQAALIMIPCRCGAQSLAALAVQTAVQGAALAVVNPLTESMQFLNVDREERARVLGLFYALILLLTAPFGYVGGLLSELDRAYPLVFSVVLFALCILLVLRISRCAAPGGANALSEKEE